MASGNYPLCASEIPLAEESCTWEFTSLWNGSTVEYLHSAKIRKAAALTLGKVNSIIALNSVVFLFLISEFKAAVGKKRKVCTPLSFWSISSHQCAQFSWTLSSLRTDGGRGGLLLHHPVLLGSQHFWDTCRNFSECHKKSNRRHICFWLLINQEQHLSQPLDSKINTSGGCTTS